MGLGIKVFARPFKSSRSKRFRCVRPSQVKTDVFIQKICMNFLKKFLFLTFHPNTRVIKEQLALCLTLSGLNETLLTHSFHFI